MVRWWEELWEFYFMLSFAIGGEEMEAGMDLWTAVGNECLIHALRILQKETALTCDEINAVVQLTTTAAKLEEINLLWAAQNRSVAAGGMGQLFSQQQAKS